MDEKEMKEALEWVPEYNSHDRPEKLWRIIMDLPKEEKNGDDPLREE